MAMPKNDVLENGWLDNLNLNFLGQKSSFQFRTHQMTSIKFDFIITF